MKKIFFAFLICPLIFSCSSLSVQTANSWLNSVGTGAADVDISGKWDTGNYMGGGWGVGHFIQSGNRFRGTLSAFNVSGAVNGRTVYMVIYGGNSVYTAKLLPGTDGSYSGHAVYQAIVDTKEAGSAAVYPIIMKRM